MENSNINDNNATNLIIYKYDYNQFLIDKKYENVNKNNKNTNKFFTYIDKKYTNDVKAIIYVLIYYFTIYLFITISLLLCYYRLIINYTTYPNSNEIFSQITLIFITVILLKLIGCEFVGLTNYSLFITVGQLDINISQHISIYYYLTGVYTFIFLIPYCLINYNYIYYISINKDVYVLLIVICFWIPTSLLLLSFCKFIYMIKNVYIPQLLIIVLSPLFYNLSLFIISSLFNNPLWLESVSLSYSNILMLAFILLYAYIKIDNNILSFMYDSYSIYNYKEYSNKTSLSTKTKSYKYTCKLNINKKIQYKIIKNEYNSLNTLLSILKIYVVNNMINNIFLNNISFYLGFFATIFISNNYSFEINKEDILKIFLVIIVFMLLFYINASNNFLLSNDNRYNNNITKCVKYTKNLLLISFSIIFVNIICLINNYIASHYIANNIRYTIINYPQIAIATISQIILNFNSRYKININYYIKLYLIINRFFFGFILNSVLAIILKNNFIHDINNCLYSFSIISIACYLKEELILAVNK